MERSFLFWLPRSTPSTSVQSILDFRPPQTVCHDCSQVFCLRLHWLGTDSSEEQLPSASTCFAKLKLPAYKWILDSSSGVRTSRLVSLKRLQLDEAAARIELGFTSLEHAAQKAPKMTSMRTLRGACKTWCCFTTGHWQQPTTVRPSR